GKMQPAIKWLFEVLSTDLRTSARSKSTRTGPAWEARTFRIDNDQIVYKLELAPRSGFRYALIEFYDRIDKLQEEVGKAKEKPKDKRDDYQAKVLDLWNRLQEFVRLSQLGMAVVPPRTPGDNWLVPLERKSELHQQAMARAKEEVEPIA